MQKMIRRLWRTSRQVMISPKRFFASIKKEKGIRHSFTFLTALVLVTFVFLTYHYIEQLNNYLSIFDRWLNISLPVEIPLNVTNYALLYIIFCITFLLLTFVRYWLTHIWVRVFRGKHGYSETYKAMSYSNTPDYISVPFLVASAIILPFAIEKNSIALILLSVIFLVITLVLSIYQMYIKTLGLSHLQGISKAKAFISIYILGFATYAAAMIMLEALVIGIALAAMIIF
ncbi:YIP1 family protein [Candidatus Woesearchaeota archaeon]|nr:YIP1 family protein [Candidatus Woesearchaeota archaeon]